MTTFPKVRVGVPVRYESLSVFPLFAEPSGVVDYLLSDEAIASGLVSVEELGESGSVPQLLVDNPSDSRVLFLEGEQLRGAKQNRVLNTSVLVPAHSKTTIPVSCVEQGRWRYESPKFSASDSHSSTKLRGFLKDSVARSLKAGGGHQSDQRAVWGEVSRQMKSMGATSETMSMGDTIDGSRDRLDVYRSQLAYVAGACGVAVAVGPKVVAVDVFDKAETCRKVWDRLLTGVVMDALEAGPAASSDVSPADVESLLDSLDHSSWQTTPAVGEGVEYRSDSVPNASASSLVLGESVLHGSVVVAV